MISMNALICDDKSWEDFSNEYDKIKNMTDEEFEQYLNESKQK